MAHWDDFGSGFGNPVSDDVGGAIHPIILGDVSPH
jgi:hypothetical protein